MSNEPDDLSKAASRIESATTEGERESYIQRQMNKISDDYELPPQVQHVQTFTDVNRLFETDQHGLIEGRTRYGKTTLKLTLLKKFINRGVTVLDRDDGGLEFRYLASYVPSRVFIPNDPNISFDLLGFKADVVKFDNPMEIIDQVWRYDYPYNVIVYDVFSMYAAQKAEFYSKLFMGMIFKLQQMRDSYKRRVVFGVDELNDLIPPRGKGSREFGITRSDIEMNIRKIGKHKVQLIGTSHRFNQIGIDTRSQFDQIYIKKSYGYDAWDFLSKNLIASNNKTFWRMMKLITTLPKNEFVFFDENRNFDRYSFPDIPRSLPNGTVVDVEALGSLELKTKEKKAQDVSQFRLVKLIDNLVSTKRMELEEACSIAGFSHQRYYGLKRKFESSPLEI